MPHIDSQKVFQKWQKPTFCYLCGESLNNGAEVNDDHCPPQGLFLADDRNNYPIKVSVHHKCNHGWHAADEKFATVYAMMHGLITQLDGKRREPTFHNVQNDQGRFLGVTDFPIREFAYRVMRCAHALLYGKWLPTNTQNNVHIPIPEVDPENGNRPKMHLEQSYSFAKVLCTAQRTDTYDSIVAYGGKFKYVTTWTHADKGEPFCLFAFDVYRLHELGIEIKDFPKAIVGFYRCDTPTTATRVSNLEIGHSDEEILYPILI